MTTVFDLMQNHGLASGFIVESKAGHDLGRIYLVLRVEGCFAWLADGTYRSLEKPKRKRVKHLRPLAQLPELDFLQQLEAIKDIGQANSELRRLIQDQLASHSAQSSC
jgi:hypothetical protein